MNDRFKAGPNNPQIVEVTPEKKIVWSFKDFKNFDNALPVAQVLDVVGINYQKERGGYHNPDKLNG